MSDTSKKRSRKSKLVPRDCGEDEGHKRICMEELTKTLLSELETEDRQLDNLPNPLQTVLPKLRTQLDKSYDHDDAVTSRKDLQFSVNIKVEECGDNDDNEDCSIVSETQNVEENKWPVRVSEKEYRSTVEKLSKITKTLADKILEVHIHNYLGRYVNEVPDETDCFEKTIQDMLNTVQQWQKQSKLREAILSYKCYICDIGWWHLRPFKEHIREHGEKTSISFQTSACEGCLVAHYDPVSVIKEIPIEGRCWQCMKTWDEHANLKRKTQPYYSCASCTFKTLTCSALLEHEGTCIRYHKEHIKETVNYETIQSCSICSINCITEKRLKAHMILSHFVRSDFPSLHPIVLKKCAQCHLDYILHVFHPCRSKPMSVICNYCLRRFHGKLLAEIHMTYTPKNVHCRVCNAFLRSQCMEVEHMTRHSRNYVLLYKCTVCTEDIWFHTERLMKIHKRLHPDKKYAKNSYFEMVVAPRKLFPSLPYLDDDLVKPHILGPKLAPVPKRLPSMTERSAAETQSAVDAIRCDQYDVHDHDYLQHYNSTTELQNIPIPEDDVQQEIAYSTTTAVESITDVTVKPEIEDYDYIDQTEMDIVYEDIDIKKEEFLDTLSNAFISAQDITDRTDDQYISNVFEVSKQMVTVAMDEKKIDELLNDGDANKTVQVTTENEDVEIKKEILIDEDDFEDDIIVLGNGNESTTDKSDVVPADDNKDDIDDVDVTIIDQIKNEVVDISDTEMQENDDNSNKDDDNSDKASDETNETLNNKKSTVKKKTGKLGKKRREKNKIYKCSRCDFKGIHCEFKTHINTKCFRNTKTHEPEWVNYPCSKCKRTYPSFKQYIYHLKQHNITPNTCVECSEVFLRPCQLSYHVRSHILRMFSKIYILLEKDTCITSRQDKVYQCKKCLEVVKYKKFFKHWESHLKLENKREINVECKIERDETIDESVLAQMELTPDMLQLLLDLLRAPPKRLECQTTPPCVLCYRPFSRASYLKRHYIEHLLRDALCKRVGFRTETLACQICDEQFFNNLNYKQHMRNHASLPVYRCELCARSFSDSSNFAKHKKVHNITEAVCDLCGTKFAKKESLIKHMKMHQHTEPIQCKHCPKVFHRESHYSRHLKTHAEKTSFTCNICLTRFPSVKERLDHLWTAHRIRKKKVDCPLCNRSFRKFHDMKYHLKVKHNAGLRLKSSKFFSASEADRSYSCFYYTDGEAEGSRRSRKESAAAAKGHDRPTAE